jgi:hypothetical protein
MDHPGRVKTISLGLGQVVNQKRKAPLRHHDHSLFAWETGSRILPDQDNLLKRGGCFFDIHPLIF